MKALIIEYKKIQAVKPFIAKNHVRYYANGVHINTEDGMLEATDGHRLIRVDISKELDALGEDKQQYKNLILFLPTEIKGNTKNGTTVTVNTENKTITATTKDISVQHPLTIIDDIYPNTSAILPKRSQIKTDYASPHPVCLNATYLASLEKAFGKNVGIVILSMADPGSPVIIAPEDGTDYWGETAVTIMPRLLGDAAQKKTEEKKESAA